MPSDGLPDDSETLKAMLLAERAQNERLRQIIKDLQRHQFGRGPDAAGVGRRRAGESV
jgi:transposase